MAKPRRIKEFLKLTYPIIPSSNVTFVQPKDPSDLSLGYGLDFQTISNYYPYGMQMPGMGWSEGRGYRYGYQEQEKDDETYGEGNMTTAEFWQYDTRLGRRWNRDPVVVSNESSYATFRNDPIMFDDIKGTFHVHPAGTKLKYENGQPFGLLYFEQSPSSGILSENGHNTGDVENATFNGKNPSVYNIVAGAGSERVYIYGTSCQNQDGKCYNAEFPLDKFRNIGNEIDNP